MMKSLCIACFFVFIMGFASVSLSAEQVNLLVNPGFEKTEPLGWRGYGDSTYDTETHRSGAQSGKTWAWDYGDGLFEQYVSITPGMQYKASVYALSKTGDPISGKAEAWIQIEWYTADDVKIGDPVKSVPLTGASSDWTLLSTPASVAPLAAAKAKIKVIIQAPENQTTGSCYFDDAVFASVDAI